MLDRDPTGPGLAALASLLTDELSRRRAALRAHLASREQTMFQIELSLIPEGLDNLLANSGRPPMKRPIAKLLRKFCAKSWRRIAKRGNRLVQLSTEDRHTLRKDLKRMRYAVEFGLPLFPGKATRTFLKDTARLQEIFGYLNDVAMARKLVAMPAIAAVSDPALHQGVGLVIGWHEATAGRAWDAARSGWKRLDRCEKPWH